MAFNKKASKTKYEKFSMFGSLVASKIESLSLSILSGIYVLNLNILFFFWILDLNHNSSILLDAFLQNPIEDAYTQMKRWNVGTNFCPDLLEFFEKNAWYSIRILREKSVVTAIGYVDDIDNCQNIESQQWPRSKWKQKSTTNYLVCRVQHFWECLPIQITETQYQ